MTMTAPRPARRKRPPRAHLRPTRPGAEPFPVANMQGIGNTLMPGPVVRTAPQRVPERVIGVGADTGQPYFQIGDNPNGPEVVEVTPPGQPGPSPVDNYPKAAMASVGGSLVPTYQTGGTLVVGPAPPFSTNLSYNPVTGGYDQINPAASPAPVQAAPTATGPAATQLAATTNVLNQQQAVIPYSAAANTAQAGVYTARNATIAPQANYIMAQGNVIGTQQTQLAGSKGLIQQGIASNAMQLTEEQNLQSAARNVADKTAIAQAQKVTNDELYKYDLAGETRPIEVVDDANAGKMLAPGVRARLRTQEEIVGQSNEEAQRIRAIQLNGAKLAVDLLGTDVDAAKLEAAKVGLSVDQAKLLVQQAENTAGLANVAEQNARLNVTQAEVDASRTKLPPQAGMVMYTNPQTLESSWVTPFDKATYDARDTRDFTVTQPGKVLYRDPFTGIQTYEYQADADRMNQEYQQRLSTVGGANQLADITLAPLNSLLSGLIDQEGNGLYGAGAVIQEVARRLEVAGMTRDQAMERAQQLVTSEYAGRSSQNLENMSPQNRAAWEAYGKPYTALTVDEKISLIDRILELSGLATQ